MTIRAARQYDYGNLDQELSMHGQNSGNEGRDGQFLAGCPVWPRVSNSQHGLWRRRPCRQWGFVNAADTGKRLALFYRLVGTPVITTGILRRAAVP